jgi:hypothetical protein
MDFTYYSFPFLRLYFIKISKRGISSAKVEGYKHHVLFIMFF